MIRIFVLFFYIISFIFTADQTNNQHPKMQSAPIVSFGIISDVQYCDCDKEGNRYYRSSLEKLRHAINELDNPHNDFIINMGDLIDRDYKSFKPVMEILNNTNIKIYHLTGNHDYSVKRRYKNRVQKMLTGNKTYRSFKNNGFRFIILNTCEISTYSGVAGSARKARKIIAEMKQKGKPNALDYNGGPGKEQLAWFRNELKMSVSANEKVLVFSHHPILPEGAYNSFRRDSLLNIVSDYSNIIAWFSGHDHRGGYDNYNMTHFVTTKGMVESPDKNAWALVEIYHNKLWIKGYGREKSQILAY